MSAGLRYGPLPRRERPTLAALGTEFGCTPAEVRGALDTLFPAAVLRDGRVADAGGLRRLRAELYRIELWRDSGLTNLDGGRA